VGNLADVPQAAVLADQVRPEVVATTGRPDLVVLDPPRSGAGREVMRAVLDLAPRAIGYVACDPAALARDCATAFSSGWALRSIRGFDAFPMTHHIECVAILEPAP
jgi:tRNA/tmRNA/rRNA uracil-C5-methylase (TrmA/RlmC/RlmD family)